MTATDPPSPCNGICAIDPASQLCRGGARTLGEIAVWGGSSAHEKRAILGQIAKRQSVSVKST